jgi:hypothetical protein
MTRSIKDLIGYNANRDNELEVICQDQWYKFLEENGWEPEVVEVKDIFLPNCTEFTEWNGIVYATHPELSFSVMFFIEVKQLFTIPNYRDFQKRLQDISELIANLDLKLKESNCDYRKMARKLVRYARSGDRPTMKILGVIASPLIDNSTMEAVMNDRTCFLTMIGNMYDRAELFL